MTDGPRLLDLFCGAGGAAAGYRAAGFYVVGIDSDPQPHYLGNVFAQADALDFVWRHWQDFDAIHASPPCQPYSRGVSSASSPTSDTLGRDEPALIEPIRQLLRATGLPYVIENVEGAPLDGIILCGSMFGLDIPRHRIFESNLWLLSPGHPDCNGMAKRAAARRGWDYREMSVTGKGRRAGTSLRWSELLGIDWHEWQATQTQIKEAIPPAYTEYVGQQIRTALERPTY